MRSAGLQPGVSAVQLLVLLMGLTNGVFIVEAGEHPECGFGAGSCSQPNETPGCELEDCCNLVCDADAFCCEIQWDLQCVDTAEELCGIIANCPTVGSCYEEHPGPGCGDGDCCFDVCLQLPECCEIEWTAECAEAAFEECPCGAPGAEDCFAEHDSPGCAEESCCDTVCSIDGFCCFFAWDDACVSEAVQFCGAAACDLTCPAGALIEPEACPELYNEGCNPQVLEDPPPPEPPPTVTPIACGDVFCGTAFADGSRDTDWFEVTVNSPTNLSWTVTSEFPASAIIVQGDCSTHFGPVAEAFAANCTAQSAQACVPSGTYRLFVSPAIEERSLRSGAPCPDPKDPVEGLWGIDYVAHLSCTPCAGVCTGDVDQDGDVDVSDLLQLLSQWGPCAGSCTADFDMDNEVDIFDLLMLLAAWGDCP